MLAAIYVAIGFMAIVLKSQKKTQKNFRNLYVLTARKLEILRNCIVCANNHMMNHNFIFVVINARTGSMVVALVLSKVKQNSLMSMFVLRVKKIIL